MKKLRLENTGPIDFLEIDFASDEGEAPKPLVMVGRNGSGKSIVLSHIVSAMMNAHGAVYEDTDVERGKVYKMRSPLYIRNREHYSLSVLNFSNDFFESEITLNRSKKQFEDELGYAPIFSKWAEMEETESSHYASNFDQRKNKMRSEFQGPNLYFPPNRFEEPAWLNEINLKNKIDYTDIKRIRDRSNRQILQYSPMKQNQSWLLDLIYDSFALETKTIVTMRIGMDPLEELRQSGPATILRREVDKFVVKLLGGQEPIMWNVGERSNRAIGITEHGGSILTQNLFSLSTGQLVLLDLFLTMLRHADLSRQTINSLKDISGLVVIDEVDLHLHADLQHEFLPILIQSFPGVQFILSTHSPLFLLGMEKTLGEDGFVIVDLPSGEVISAERFNEFERAYQHLTSTRKFESDISQKVSEASQPLLIVEGTIDVDYITKAAEHLEETQLLSQFIFVDGDGSPGLNKIWKNLHTEKWTNINQPVILLYDCDENNKNNEIGKAFQRTIPEQDTIIQKGVENLFPTDTIHRARKHKAAFVDYAAASSGVERGKEYVTPESWTINRDEKRNLCDWLCENGTRDDFANFSDVFDILRDCLS